MLALETERQEVARMRLAEAEDAGAGQLRKDDSLGNAAGTHSNDILNLKIDKHMASN